MHGSFFPVSKQSQKKAISLERLETLAVNLNEFSYDYPFIWVMMTTETRRVRSGI